MESTDPTVVSLALSCMATLARIVSPPARSLPMATASLQAQLLGSSDILFMDFPSDQFSATQANDAAESAFRLGLEAAGFHVHVDRGQPVLQEQRRPLASRWSLSQHLALRSVWQAAPSIEDHEWNPSMFRHQQASTDNLCRAALASLPTHETAITLARQTVGGVGPSEFYGNLPQQLLCMDGLAEDMPKASLLRGHALSTNGAIALTSLHTHKYYSSKLKQAASVGLVPVFVTGHNTLNAVFLPTAVSGVFAMECWPRLHDSRWSLLTSPAYSPIDVACPPEVLVKDCGLTTRLKDVEGFTNVFKVLLSLVDNAERERQWQEHRTASAAFEGKRGEGADDEEEEEGSSSEGSIEEDPFEERKTSKETSDTTAEEANKPLPELRSHFPWAETHGASSGIGFTLAADLLERFGRRFVEQNSKPVEGSGGSSGLLPSSDLAPLLQLIMKVAFAGLSMKELKGEEQESEVSS